jgi:hypothetical protein
MNRSHFLQRRCSSVSSALSSVHPNLKLSKRLYQHQSGISQISIEVRLIPLSFGNQDHRYWFRNLSFKLKFRIGEHSKY